MKDVILYSQSEQAVVKNNQSVVPYSYFLLETDELFATENCRLDILNSDTQYLRRFFALTLIAISFTEAFVNF